MAPAPAKILVAGAAGYFGRIMVDELLSFTDYQVVLAGRNLNALRSLQQVHATHISRLSVIELHLDRRNSVSAALENIDVAVCAAGPFQAIPHFLLEGCLTRGIHYIDMADDRPFVSTTLSLAAKCTPRSAVCSGWSTVPALSALLVEAVRERFQTIDEIHIQIAPGNRSPRAPGTVASLLSSMDRRFDIMQGGKWQNVRGWSHRRIFYFPQPVGARAGYLIDVPDHFLFPEIFSAQTVEFRAGAEVDLFNHGLSMLTQLSASGLVKSWLPFQHVLQCGMSMFGFLGTDSGAVGVAVRGQKDGRRVGVRHCLIANTRGQNIPVMPAVAMVSRLVNGNQNEAQTFAGPVPYNTWLSTEQLVAECGKRGYKLTVEECEETSR